MQNNDILKKGLVWGIIICMLLIVNTSTVISISDEKVITKEKKNVIFLRIHQEKGKSNTSKSTIK
jgi:hypothetical protein